LTGSDLGLDFKYKYDRTAGKGATVYVLGMFLSHAI